MCSNCLTSMPPAEWVYFSWCSSSASLYPGDSEPGKISFSSSSSIILKLLYSAAGGSDWPSTTWLATTPATSLSAAGPSSLRLSALASSSSSWSPGRTWSTRTTTTPGGPTLLDTSWPAAPCSASRSTPSGCGSPRRALGERSDQTYQWLLYSRY